MKKERSTGRQGAQERESWQRQWKTDFAERTSWKGRVAGQSSSQQLSPSFEILVISETRNLCVCGNCWREIQGRKEKTIWRLKQFSADVCWSFYHSYRSVLLSCFHIAGKINAYQRYSKKTTTKQWYLATLGQYIVWHMICLYLLYIIFGLLCAE